MSDDDKNFDFVEAKGNDRLNFNQKFYGDCLFDLQIFNIADNLMVDYNGGYWEYYTWNDTVAFYVLAGDAVVTLRNFSGDELTMSSTLAGMIITIFTVLRRLEKTQSEKDSDKFYALQDLIYAYAEEIGEVEQAFKMLD